MKGFLEGFCMVYPGSHSGLGYNRLDASPSIQQKGVSSRGPRCQ